MSDPVAPPGEPTPERNEQVTVRRRSRSRRIRVVNDRHKYLRHRIKKFFRHWGHYFVWTAAFIGVAILIWMLLRMLVKPPPLE